MVYLKTPSVVDVRIISVSNTSEVCEVAMRHPVAQLLQLVNIIYDRSLQRINPRESRFEDAASHMLHLRIEKVFLVFAYNFPTTTTKTIDQIRKDGKD
jgi:hypothetical protein